MSVSTTMPDAVWLAAVRLSCGLTAPVGGGRGGKSGWGDALRA